jgi:sulfatase modifying factor 1
MDKTEVTRAQFRAFVESTGYITDAERLGGAVLDPRTHTWRIDLGATWRTPFGDAAPPPPEDHPVSQVSWRDASAFCQAYSLRLPSEAEWEHAARLGQAPGGVVFMFGSQPLREGEYLANFWQGLFPVLNTVQDGYRYTAPVGRFGVAPSGLTDMAGNVWEWTEDWYRPYSTRDQRFTPDETSERVQRGGSFLCDPNICQGYRVTARGHATPDSAHMHVGFRCASSIAQNARPQRTESHSSGDL